MNITNFRSVLTKRSFNEVSLVYLHPMFKSPSLPNELDEVSAFFQLLSLPGHSNSLISDSKFLTWDKMSISIGSWLLEQPKKSIILGNSLGAAIALKIAASKEFSPCLYSILLYRIPTISELRLNFIDRYNNTANYIEKYGLENYIEIVTKGNNINTLQAQELKTLGKTKVIGLFRGAAKSNIKETELNRIKVPVGFIDEDNYDEQHPKESKIIVQKLLIDCKMFSVSFSEICECLIKLG